MSQDLSQLFAAGLTRGDSWNESKVFDVATSLAGAQSRVDWERGDEQWARVVDSDGAVLALVCVPVPIGIVLSETLVKGKAMEVDWIIVRSMSEKKYKVSCEVLQRIFGRKLSQNVDYSQLSIDELWWATVS